MSALARTTCDRTQYAIHSHQFIYYQYVTSILLYNRMGSVYCIIVIG